MQPKRKAHNRNRALSNSFLLLSVLLLVFICTEKKGFAVCSLYPSTTIVRTTDVPFVSSFQIPIGDNLRTYLHLLSFQNFTNFNYPKIRFNDNGDNTGNTNEWFVATAFNKNRWLNNGWNTEPSNNDNSYYCASGTCSSTNFQYHPGEDWNSTLGNSNWPNGDLGAPIYPIADGVVLFSGMGYGNTIIIVHKIFNDKNETEYITSFYGHFTAGQIFNSF